MSKEIRGALSAVDLERLRSLLLSATIRPDELARRAGLADATVFRAATGLPVYASTRRLLQLVMAELEEARTAPAPDANSVSPGSNAP